MSELRQAQLTWKECKLSDVAIIVDCEHKTAPLVENSEYYSIRTTDINNGKINFNAANRVSKEIYDEWTKRIIPQHNDLILAREAPVGEVGWVDKRHKVCLGQRTVLIRANATDIEPRYLLYYLVNGNAKNDLINQSAGSVVQHLNVKNIREFQLKVINPLPEQRAIAGVLSSLDDKIDLMHRQNKTLEQMAEAMFRQWFRPPGPLKGEIKETGPLEGVEEQSPGLLKGESGSQSYKSPLGDLGADDLEEGKLGDVIELYYGKGLKTEERTGSSYPVVGSSGIVDYHSEFLVEGPGIVIGRKGTLGKVIYLWDNFYPIDTTYYVKSKVESVGLFYEYFLLKTINFEDMNTDSAVPGLNRDIALSTEIIIAPENKIHNFNEFVVSFVDKIKKNKDQINTLEKLRDTLLPRLMSGELRVTV